MQIRPCLLTNHQAWRFIVLASFMFIVYAELNDGDNGFIRSINLNTCTKTLPTHKGRLLMSPKSPYNCGHYNWTTRFHKRISQRQKLEIEYKFRLAISLSFYARQYWSDYVHNICQASKNGTTRQIREPTKISSNSRHGQFARNSQINFLFSNVVHLQEWVKLGKPGWRFRAASRSTLSQNPQTTIVARSCNYLILIKRPILGSFEFVTKSLSK